MRSALIAALSVLALVVPAAAQNQNPPDVKGLFLLTDYPAVSVRPGNTATINLKLQN